MKRTGRREAASVRFRPGAFRRSCPLTRIRRLRGPHRRPVRILGSVRRFARIHRAKRTWRPFRPRSGPARNRRTRLDAPGQSAQTSHAVPVERIEQAGHRSYLVQHTTGAASGERDGLATAQPPLRGEATLQAELTGTGRRASREVLVLPDGTFRLVGTVMEADARTSQSPERESKPRLTRIPRRLWRRSRRLDRTAGTSCTASRLKPRSAF